MDPVITWAAFHGHKAVAQLPLERKGVDVNSKNSDDKRPLSEAAADGHEAVVRLLLEQGVDIAAKDA
ncbi:MAG: hypothetical protein M1839_003981 [Geoglossum umbratile]|nr:MAG: hypothetical protein M1839_003981 [Geoglossum umbratile]